MLQPLYHQNTPKAIISFSSWGASYNMIDRVFVNLGLETTWGTNIHPHTLNIIGFTENTVKEDLVLNDFKMRNTFSSISIGIAYVLGFSPREDSKD